MDYSMGESKSDSNWSPPEISDGSSSSSPKNSNNRQVSRKRRLTAIPTALQRSTTRVNGSFNDQYRKLFNETVNEIVLEDAAEDGLLHASRVGVSLWSSEEKAALSTILAKKGPHDLKGIADRLIMKSESEVYLYLYSLHKAALDQHIYCPVKNLFKPYEIDIAVEISDDCGTALDRAAEALSALQQKEDEREEKSLYPDFPILTPKIAHWVDRQFSAGEAGENEISKALPAATLLNLKNFLTVSKRFFMNSANPEGNWRTHTEKRQPPTIMYTAFSDFHTLACSVTRRLIQSCLFIAMSRLKATTAPGHYIPQRHVKRRDVLAALELVGLKANARAFWASVARKCSLRVYEDVKRRQVYGKKYSYGEIENLLSRSEAERRGRVRAPSLDSYGNSVHGEQGTNVASSESLASASDTMSSESPFTEKDELHDSSDNINRRQLPSQRDINHSRDQGRQEQVQEAYSEALDQRASRSEEKRLWAMLGENPAEKMNTEDIPLPKAPYPQRKDKEDLVDWKIWTHYAGEWEINQSPISQSMFANNRSVGRKHGLDAGLTDSEPSENGPGGEQSADEACSSDDSLLGKPQGAVQRSIDEMDTSSEEIDRQNASLNSGVADTLGIDGNAENATTQIGRPSAKQAMSLDEEDSND